MERPTDSENSTPVDSASRFARMATVVHMTGLCRATIYRMIANKRFPAQVKIGLRAVGWRWSDLERWSQERTDPTH
jgi:prophage regulatory protein